MADFVFISFKEQPTVTFTFTDIGISLFIKTICLCCRKPEIYEELQTEKAPCWNLHEGFQVFIFSLIYKVKKKKG